MGSNRPSRRGGVLAALSRRIISCRRCPRLVRYLAETKRTWPDHWCRPVPGFGDPAARVLIVGLAPARHGANRTGRMFTGDAPGGSGWWVYPALHKEGFWDGSNLHGAYITAAARCAPPDNKPTPLELETCRPYLEEELRLLRKVRVVVALGRVAHDSYLRARSCLRVGASLAPTPPVRLAGFPFSHGAIHTFHDGPPILLDSYHPSRQNTQTGRLTRPMWRVIWRRAKEIAQGSASGGVHKFRTL